MTAQSKRATRAALVTVLGLFAALEPTQAVSLNFLNPRNLVPSWYSAPRREQLTRRGVPEAGFEDPRASGGSWLTSGYLTFPAGLGEPLNIILSAKSDSAVLVDQEDKGGLRNYFLSMDFSGECLGQHLGSDQQANLGDGKGAVNETAVMRFNFQDAYVGTCRETVEGGNHFRYWVQKSTGAVFMAASVELPIEQGHDIVRNGYNLGRDWIVGNLTGGVSIVSFNFPPDIPPSVAVPDSVQQYSSSSVAATNTVPPTSFVPNITFPLSTVLPTASTATPLVVALSDSFLTNSSATVTVPIAIPTASLSFTTTTSAAPTATNPTFIGQTHYGGYVYETTATYVSGLLSNSSDGVNHPITVEQNGRPAQDGLVAVLEVKIVSRPDGSGARLNMPIPTILAAVAAGLLSLGFL